MGNLLLFRILKVLKFLHSQTDILTFWFTQVNYTNSLGPLMSVPQDEFPEGKSIPEHYGPDGEYKGNLDILFH